MKLSTLATLGLGAAILAGQPALATAPVGDPLAGLQAMRELNAIVLGDTQGWLDVQGKSFVAGNLQGGGQFGSGNSKYGAAASDRATLTVGGNVAAYTNIVNGDNGKNGKVANPATLLVGGNASNLNLGVANSVAKVGGKLKDVGGSAGTTIQAGGSGSGWLGANGGSIAVNQGPAFTAGLVGGISTQAGTLDADLKALSAKLAGLGTTVGNSISDQYGAWTFNAVSDGNGVSVFNLTEAALSGWKFTLNVADAATTVIFNITGDGNYNWNTTLAGAFGPAFAGNVIWNFADASSISTNQSVYGSILAPWAQLGSNSALYGTVVSAGLRANDGVRLGTYNGGNLGFDASAVPEPATWAMLIAGFGIVGAAMRRRERIARVQA